MKIALIGFGKMSRAILDLLPYNSIECAHILTRTPPNTTWDYPQIHVWHDIHMLPWDQIDACIDFSSPIGLKERVETILRHKKPLIIGTTGWENQREEILRIADKCGTLLWGPNFSISVALHSKIIAYAAHLMSRFPEFDVGIYERHHRQKADHPSGTALQLADILLKLTPSKEEVVSNLPPGKLQNNQIHVAYSRIGTLPGYHEVLFENETDTITLSNRTSSRSTFAQGALEALLWLENRKGVFNFMDMIDERIRSNPVTH